MGKEWKGRKREARTPIERSTYTKHAAQVHHAQSAITRCVVALRFMRVLLPVVCPSPFLSHPSPLLCTSSSPFSSLFPSYFNILPSLSCLYFFFFSFFFLSQLRGGGLEEKEDEEKEDDGKEEEKEVEEKEGEGDEGGRSTHKKMLNISTVSSHISTFLTQKIKSSK